jgi:UDP-N-acetylmuramyl pentapeptide phosphotransferase/UDP-N-acetylglucosamine-1-phosphate transferase
MPTTSAYVVVFGVALAATLAATPLMRWAATRFSVISVPTSDRAVHTRPIPLLGGAAMLVGFLVAFGLAWGQSFVMFESATVPIGWRSGAALWVGTLDDVRRVGARQDGEHASPGADAPVRGEPVLPDPFVDGLSSSGRTRRSSRAVGAGDGGR